MGMTGAMAWNVRGCHPSGASLGMPPLNPAAVSVPVSSSALNSLLSREAAIRRIAELSRLQPSILSLRSSALKVSFAALRDDNAAPGFERETEGKNNRSKILLIIFRALGVGVITCSLFVLWAQTRGRKVLLSWPTRTCERRITSQLSGQELRGGPLESAQLRGTPVRNIEKRSTSNLCTYVNFVEDQDILEVDEEAFEQWMIELKNTAVRRGIPESLVVEKLHGVRPSKRIMELDSNKPEVKLTLEAYLKNMNTAYRVNKGVAGFQENELLLTEISNKYGVPSPILVAIWGIESSYGGYTGNWDVLRALVTLAFASGEPRRAQFFRGELLQALQIIQEGHGPQSGAPLRGSWAGAMGQCQFMPSSFQAYGVDYDGDGRKDIWESRADMFASMANYLERHGWQRGDLIALKVQLPDDFDESQLGLKVQRPVQEWVNKYKVRTDEGQPDPPPEEMASLIAPDGLTGSAFLVFHNFRVVMRYNISILYATAVWQLALQIMEGLGSSAPQFPELVSALKC
ncbi:hypothetical protein R1sor_016772 [Riccia sorocarpa]|uniref:Transglycosylase SLT domain-containing protein n=1 Tax=Riccia sorocarpa TaxID=122646 RepID=A0ABD3HGD7_9MARC